MSTLITYRGEVAGFACAGRFFPAPSIAALPSGDPVKRVIAYMWAYDGELRAGRLPGEYSDEQAEFFARLALIDEEQFARLDVPGTSDEELARYFEVPVDQIAKKRRDLQRLEDAEDGGGDRWK